MSAIAAPPLKATASPTTYGETLSKKDDGLMVSRIRRTLTVEERAAAFDHTSKVAQEAAEEERRHREEKSAKLRALRLAAGNGASPK